MTSMKCHEINPSNASVLRMVQFRVTINIIVILHVIHIANQEIIQTSPFSNKKNTKRQTGSLPFFYTSTVVHSLCLSWRENTPGTLPDSTPENMLPLSYFQKKTMTCNIHIKTCRFSMFPRPIYGDFSCFPQMYSICE